MFAVLMWAEHSHVARVPPRRQLHAEGVGPGVEQLGDVVRLVLDPLGVVRPAGGEAVRPDPLAVEVGLVQAEGRGVEPGPRDGLAAQPELVAQLGDGGVGGGDLAPGARAPRGEDLGGGPGSVVVVQRAPVACGFGVGGLPAVAGGDGPHAVGGRQLQDPEQSGGAGDLVGRGDGEDVTAGGQPFGDVGDRGPAPGPGDLVRFGPRRFRTVEVGDVPVVGGEHETGPGHPVRYVERAPEPAGRGGSAGRRVALREPDPGGLVQGRCADEGGRGADPAGGPVRRLGESGLPPGGLGPARDPAFVVPDPHGPVVAGTGAQLRPAVADLRRVGGLDLAAVPYIGPFQGAFAEGDADLVGALRAARRGGGERPAEARAGGAEAERVLHVLGGRAAHPEAFGPWRTAFRGLGGRDGSGDEGGSQGGGGRAEQSSSADHTRLRFGEGKGDGAGNAVGQAGRRRASSMRRAAASQAVGSPDGS